MYIHIYIIIYSYINKLLWYGNIRLHDIEKSLNTCKNVKNIKFTINKKTQNKTTLENYNNINFTNNPLVLDKQVPGEKHISNINQQKLLKYGRLKYINKLTLGV